MQKVGRELIEYQGRFWLDGYFKLKEQSSVIQAKSPVDNFVHVYAKDNGGVSQLCIKNDADVEVCFPTTGGGSLITGSGVATRVAFWDSPTNLTSDSGFSYDATLDKLTLVNLLLSGLTASKLVATDASKNLTSTVDNLADNTVLADMAAWTFKIRNAGSSGDPSDAALAGFTTATPVGADFVAGFLSTGEIRKFAVSAIGVTDHGALTGLADDDHTQYALLAGRSGGQILVGGIASGDDLTLQSTSNATRGSLFLVDLLDIQASLQLTGDITPASYATRQDDYNPTGLSTASVLRLESTGNTVAEKSITGIVGGADGRILIIHNIGAESIVLPDEHASSTAANRFAWNENEDALILPDSSLTIIYDGTSSRWRGLTRPSNNSLWAYDTVHGTASLGTGGIKITDYDMVSGDPGGKIISTGIDGAVSVDKIITWGKGDPFVGIGGDPVTTHGLVVRDGAGSTAGIRALSYDFDVNHKFGWDGTSMRILSNTDPIAFQQASEIARFDTSGRLGLGTTTPATKLDVNGAVATRFLEVTLANGANNDVAISTFSNIRIIGPSAAYSISGFANGVNGRLLWVFNTVAQTLTITNEGAGSTAANRITTLTGGDVVLRATGTSFASFIYDSTTSRWILVAIN